MPRGKFHADPLYTVVVHMEQITDTQNTFVYIYIYIYMRLNVFLVEQDRRRNLEDAIIYFRFSRECDNFESWMNDKVCASEMFAYLRVLPTDL